MVHNRYPGYDLRYGPVRGSTIILRHGPEQKISWLSKHTYGKPSAHVRPSLWAPFRPKIIRGSSSFVSGRHKAAHDYGLGSQACPACHKIEKRGQCPSCIFLEKPFPTSALFCVAHCIGNANSQKHHRLKEHSHLSTPRKVTYLSLTPMLSITRTMKGPRRTALFCRRSTWHGLLASDSFTHIPIFFYYGTLCAHDQHSLLVL